MITDEALMQVLKSIQNRLDTMDGRMAKITSDVNDIKVNQAAEQTTLKELTKCVDQLERTVFGNGTEGIGARLTAMESRIKRNEELLSDIKKFGWGLVALILGDIILRVMQVI